MRELKENTVKYQYKTPTIINLGGIQTITLGKNLYDTDNNANAAACKDNNMGGIPCS